ncbi:J domain-containing protein [Hymenobacter cavernae]|uniref:J domain-containing protein n=1 Tax=Hymenobacter cavernae TaxID=2044852 RepID=A0ABQ1TMY9_9BACT|nr:J domain-containing protein [Hymenobacter cavernae]GGE98573.1 hypothetical protein GCM10011383_06770 [Hymenobacter cavernae]
MKNYYQILELPNYAPAADIRRAYRRLVLITHPDRTPDLAAHDRYLAINEAYEVLSHPVRRQYYDALLRQPAVPVKVEASPAEELHPDPAMRRRGRRRPQLTVPTTQPLHMRYAAEFGRIVPRLRIVAGLSLVLALLVMVDFLRTKILPNEAVQDFEYVHELGQNNAATYFVVSTQHAKFEVEPTTSLTKDDRVTVYQTPWFGKVRQVSLYSEQLKGVQLQLEGNPEVSRAVMDELSKGVHLRPHSFGYAWVLLALVVGSGVGIFYPPLRIDHAFNLGFVNSVALLLLIVYLLFM